MEHPIDHNISSNNQLEILSIYYPLSVYNENIQECPVIVYHVFSQVIKSNHISQRVHLFILNMEVVMRWVT